VIDFVQQASLLYVELTKTRPIALIELSRPLANALRDAFVAGQSGRYSPLADQYRFTVKP
jgi:hypothetical protein